jgi:hypothetical protein
MTCESTKIAGCAHGLHLQGRPTLSANLPMAGQMGQLWRHRHTSYLRPMMSLKGEPLKSEIRRERLLYDVIPMTLGGNEKVRSPERVPVQRGAELVRTVSFEFSINLLTCHRYEV